MQRKLNFEMDVNFIDEWERECTKPCVPAFSVEKRGVRNGNVFLWGDANVLKSNIYKLVNKSI